MGPGAKNGCVQAQTVPFGKRNDHINRFDYREHRLTDMKSLYIVHVMLISKTPERCSLLDYSIRTPRRSAVGYNCSKKPTPAQDCNGWFHSSNPKRPWNKQTGKVCGARLNHHLHILTNDSTLSLSLCMIVARTDSAEVSMLFHRFSRFATEIDAGLSFVKKSLDVLRGYDPRRDRPFSFLEFGFAPGGISNMLLKSHYHIEGVGVTLDTAKGGLAYPEWMEAEPRFQVEKGDVCELARIKQEFLAPSCRRRVKESGEVSTMGLFDFVIMGIAVIPGYSSQIEDGFDAGVRKDFITCSQLFLALRHLKNGGMMLIRGHLSLRPLDFDILHFLTKCFRKAPTATKPLTGL